MSPLAFLLEIAIAILLVWMNARIAAKAGFSPIWALTVLVLPLYLVAAWVFALKDWPRDREPPRSSQA